MGNWSIGWVVEDEEGDYVTRGDGTLIVFGDAEEATQFARLGETPIRVEVVRRGPAGIDRPRLNPGRST